MDPEKANENIKALLEGAFESEEDEAKNKDERESVPRRRTPGHKADEVIDELTKQLEGINVDTKGDKRDRREAAKQGEDDDEDEEGEKAKEDGEKGQNVNEDNREQKVNESVVEGLKVRLLPHQIQGVKWMRNKEAKPTRKGLEPKGGILADDMGLGKTVQTIALLLTRLPPSAEERKEAKKSITSSIDGTAGAKAILKEPGKATLVVAPLALIRQWESEIEMKVEPTHRLSTCVYHGPSRSKDAQKLHKYDVVITAYGTLCSEYSGNPEDTPESGCFSNHWYRVILDEAHTIKNRNAKTTQAACALNADHRWCLTGTPMQNNLDELQSIIHFLRIKPYDHYATWSDQIMRPMNQGRGAIAINRLRVYLQAIMKRRTKDVLKKSLGGKESTGDSFRMVNRIVKTVEAELSAEESLFYGRLERRMGHSLDKMMESESKINYANALVLLLRLRQACNHPGLVNHELSNDKDGIDTKSTTSQGAAGLQLGNVEDIADLLGKMTVETKLCDVCQMTIDRERAATGAVRCSSCEEDTLRSSLRHKDSTKVRHLREILREESPKYKIIVFSFFTSMLAKLEDCLEADGVGYVRYYGAMPNDHRERSLSKLRNDSKTRVLLCSLKAGALGLNLTAASRVVILEPFWNPFVEEQAIDRVHRINQTVDVKVYKLVVKGTVEERIVTLQERKRQLANAVIEGKSDVGKLTMKDMMALFGRGAEFKFAESRERQQLPQEQRKMDDSSNRDSKAIPSLPPQSSSSATYPQRGKFSSARAPTDKPLQENLKSGTREPEPKSESQPQPDSESGSSSESESSAAESPSHNRERQGSPAPNLRPKGEDIFANIKPANRKKPGRPKTQSTRDGGIEQEQGEQTETKHRYVQYVNSSVIHHY